MYVGQKIYDERRKYVTFYPLEEKELMQGTQKILPGLPDKLTMLDLGAGMSGKITRWLDMIVKAKPDIRICYVPIDISEVVSKCTELIRDNCPHLSKNIEYIKPIVGDMNETLANIGKLPLSNATSTKSSFY